MDVNLTFFRTSPLPPSKRGNEIVYDSQGVIERKFYVLTNSFCLFNALIPPCWRELAARAYHKGSF